MKGNQTVESPALGKRNFIELVIDLLDLFIYSNLQ